MSVSAPFLPACGDAAGGLTDVVQSPSGELSCRVPVLLLWIGAVKWLAFAWVLRLLASVKLHAPGFLAECPWLTYGRLVPAESTAMLYGFAVPAGLGILLWLICRLSKTPLAGTPVLGVATIFWNLGVAGGVLGILGGAQTGFELLEMPRGLQPILFCAYVLIGGGALVGFMRRRSRELHVSQWFAFSALFWFPWIFTTASLLLVFFPVRGVLQAAVGWWFANNLRGVWLGQVGLATLFYLIPKILNRPLHSRQMAVVAFWSFVMFGPWVGIPQGAPLPAWMPSLSAVATVWMIIPVIAIAANLHGTLVGRYSTARDNLSLRFLVFGAGSYLLAGLTAMALTSHWVSRFTLFTLITPAQQELSVTAFYMMTLIGAMYYAVPRLTKQEWPFRKLATLHFWCAAVGTIISVGSLALAGTVQGMLQHDKGISFTAMLQTFLPFLRFGTLGNLLIAIGALAFLINLVGILARFYCNTRHSRRSLFNRPEAVSSARLL